VCTDSAEGLEGSRGTGTRNGHENGVLLAACYHVSAVFRVLSFNSVQNKQHREHC
jgi:hypothetical protein